MKSDFFVSITILGLCLSGMVMPGCTGKNEHKALVASAPASSPHRDSSPSPAAIGLANETGKPGPNGEAITTQVSPDSRGAKTSLPGDSLILPGDIKVLKEAVVQAQKKYVRTSYNEYDCYTDAMYNQFKKEEMASKIAMEVVTRKEIRAAILTLRAVPATNMKKEINKLRQSLRKTWEQRGEISPEGQTVAGQKAEIDISYAIADKVLQCCQDPGWTPSITSR